MPTQDYEKIPESLTIHFEADELDLLNLGVLGYHLHTVLNQVAITIFQVHDELVRGEGQSPSLKFIPQSYNREDRLVSARITGLRQGSLEMDVAGFVAAVFSQPGAVAIVHNLFSSAIWAIAKYSTRIPGVRVNLIRFPQDELVDALLSPVAGRKKLRPKVERFIELLAESSHGGKLRLKTKDAEIEIEFYGGQTKKQH